MNTSLLSDDKQTHLAHVILSALEQGPGSSIIGDSAQALREIKRVLAEQVKAEEALIQIVRHKLQSYSRPIPEGSQEWDVLYQKTYEEELRKRNLE